MDGLNMLDGDLFCLVHAQNVYPTLLLTSTFRKRLRRNGSTVLAAELKR